MRSKTERTLLLSGYFLSPIIVSLIYWFVEFENNQLHRIGSICGIFSYIWLCFNIVMVTKINILERNFSLKGLIRFHILMATVAILLGALHTRPTLYPPKESYDFSQIISGALPALIFIILLPLASIYMTNHMVKNKIIMKRRIDRFLNNIEYNFHKVLHNITMLAVSVIFIHTLLSTTVTVGRSVLITVIYSLFFGVTLIIWIYHKIIRKYVGNPDPYGYRKAKWDDISPQVSQDKDIEWAGDLMRKSPTLYPCLQCGSCTSVCPVSEITEGKFNPRMIMENTLLGLKNKAMIDKIPNVWECTTCYSCVEECPQNVELIEIYMHLKNQFAEIKDAPEKFIGEAKAVYDTGEAIPLQNAIIERRKKLELPPQPELDIQEIQDILDDFDIGKLVNSSKIDKMEGEL